MVSLILSVSSVSVSISPPPPQLQPWTPLARKLQFRGQWVSGHLPWCMDPGHNRPLLHLSVKEPSLLPGAPYGHCDRVTEEILTGSQRLSLSEAGWGRMRWSIACWRDLSFPHGDLALMGLLFLKTPVTDKARGGHVSSWYHLERQMKAISEGQMSHVNGSPWKAQILGCIDRERSILHLWR